MTKTDIKKFFKKQELIPAIVQEARSGDVLMLAYMSEESLTKTLETGYTWFFSRSRQRLWQKGEESGHVQKVVSITGDCDDDTLLVKVEQTGPACHTGSKTCFFAPPVFADERPGSL
ncbi:MAG: phosphoribosyl-AMP cyclohydrolase [Clostridiales Family XIII bacterium]|jgi:phosphoribosyl-AMP cyclohydrolase/phosphoribosyl-ATP pyrophosphohydrolase/phosphoribosyl-AMP cyclohydrolase|nr:phosphoribosyl-AMP cyclohydrolase [Clostridiales Family XIII bacterium]